MCIEPSVSTPACGPFQLQNETTWLQNAPAPGSRARAQSCAVESAVMRTVAVVLAGGAGERFGPGVPKQLLTLAGRTLLERSVAAFEQAPGVDEILVVMAAGNAKRSEALLAARG